MLNKTLAKVDRYYPILAVVVIGLFVLMIFTLRGIFRALNTASEFDPRQGGSTLKIEKEKLDELYQKVKERKVPGLTGAP
jgi:uncharacterized membrane protein